MLISISFRTSISSFTTKRRHESKASRPSDRMSEPNFLNSCTISSDQITIRRSAFIAGVSICAIITTISLVAITFVAFREWRKRKQNQKAKAWARQTLFGLNGRISMMKKEVDDSFSRQYKGVLIHETMENPEMGSESPVEIGRRDSMMWEMPAMPSRALGTNAIRERDHW